MPTPTAKPRLKPRIGSCAACYRLTAVLACIICTTVGCSSQAGRQAELFTFSTRITPSGLKLFELSYPFVPRRLTLPGSSSRTGSQQPARREQPAYSDRQLERALTTKLNASGYCREGYILLGRHSGITAQTIRGECRELATTDDREQFQDTIGRW